MTKLYVKNGKMLVTNGKLRQCCCSVNRRVSLTNARVDRYTHTNGNFVSTHKFVSDELFNGVLTSTVTSVYCDAPFQRFFATLDGDTLTQTTTGFAVGTLFSITFAAFDAAAVGELLYTDTIAGATVGYCTYPDRVREVRKLAP